MRKHLIILLVGLSLLLAACGQGSNDSNGSAGSSGSAGAGDAEKGKELFEQNVIGSNSAPGCATCHSLEPDKILVGPSMAGARTRAAEAVQGQSAEEYLHESIVEPDAHVAEGFPAGVMYQNYDEDLSEQEINDLVSYLLTLK